MKTNSFRFIQSNVRFEPNRFSHELNRIRPVQEIRIVRR